MMTSQTLNSFPSNNSAAFSGDSDEVSFSFNISHGSLQASHKTLKCVWPGVGGANGHPKEPRLMFQSCSSEVEGQGSVCGTLNEQDAHAGPGEVLP